MHDKRPRLIRSDAELLAALTEHGKPGSPRKLRDVINDYDWLNRLVPSYDVLSFGLPRLMAAGYVEVDRAPGRILRLIPTAKATALRSEIQKDAHALGDASSGLAKALGCYAYPEPEVEDRSLGRLPGFEEAEWRAAFRAYERWFDHWSKPVLAFGRVFQRFLVRLRPDDYRDA